MHGTPALAPAAALAGFSPAPAPVEAPAAPATDQSGKSTAAGHGPPLATILVRTGQLKGKRLPVRVPVINIGRADYNDVVLPDESVSTSHAKLQRREGVWILTDIESTNGTFVDGERVQGDAPLAPGAMVRFGDVQLVFEPTDDAMGVAKGGGTKMIEAFKVPAPPAPAPKAAPPAKATPKRPVPPPVAEKKGKGCGPSAAVLLLGFVAVAYWILT